MGSGSEKNSYGSTTLVFRILIPDPDPRANSDEEIVVLVDFFVYLS
jgi:hypothetical protein